MYSEWQSYFLLLTWEMSTALKIKSEVTNRANYIFWGRISRANIFAFVELRNHLINLERCFTSKYIFYV